MKRVLLVLLFCCVIAGCSNGSSSENFEYSISECGEVEIGDEELVQGIRLEVSDGSIVMQQIIESFCNANDDMGLQLKREGNVLEIKEVYVNSLAAECICVFDIQATIDNLEPGEYELKVRYKEPYSEFETLLEKNIQIS
jgi:hypothetical protein